jgi:hypothetical protein
MFHKVIIFFLCGADIFPKQIYQSGTYCPSIEINENFCVKGTQIAPSCHFLGLLNSFHTNLPLTWQGTKKHLIRTTMAAQCFCYLPSRFPLIPPACAALQNMASVSVATAAPLAARDAPRAAPNPNCAAPSTGHHADELTHNAPTPRDQPVTRIPPPPIHQISASCIIFSLMLKITGRDRARRLQRKEKT